MAILPPLTDQHQARFEHLLATETDAGWRIQSQTLTTAQLIQPRKFSGWWFLAWMVFSLGTLWWIYLIYWASKRQEQMFLELQPDGWILRTVYGRQERI